MRQNDSRKLSLFPLTKDINSLGHLHIGGCDCVELAKKFGTPLYVFDEVTIRSRCQEFKTEFTQRYSSTLIIYASKAFLNRALAIIFKEEGLGLDVVSGGELSVAQSVDFPCENVYFHGNNKTADELKLALDWGIGRIVVDNFDELALLNSLAHKAGAKQAILLRLNPGVDPHTHRYTTTGILDSKFGFPLATGQAETAVAKAMATPNLDLVGLHFHLGSPIPDTSPYQIAISLVLNFAKEMKTKFDFHPVIIEPGRAIVAQAGVALYTIGSIKEIPGVRKYICVDGGMGDNIRPALYEARYEVLAANKVSDDKPTNVTIAGKYCESGDILARDVSMASVSTGDVVAIPISGAYSIPMSSNYNMMPRPAIVMVKDGKARLIRKRENYKDLTRLDLI